MTSPAAVSSAPEPVAAQDSQATKRARPAWAPELLWLALTAVVTMTVVVIDLQLWRMDPRVPLFGSTGDVSFFLTNVKSVLDHGWFSHNPSLGAPFGQENFDFSASFGDLAHYGVIWAIGLFTDDAALAMNVFFLLCFPLIAMSAYGVSRDLGVPCSVALVVGLLFTFLPYHLIRNQQHLVLSAYYAVPLGIWLVIAVAEGRRLLDRAAPRRTVVTIAVCLLVAAASNYYAVFTLLVLALVVPVAALARRSPRILAQGVAVGAIVLAMFAVAHSPSIVYSLQNGTNEAVGTRQAFESELYGLKLTQMVIPRDGHRIERLSREGIQYIAQNPIRAEGFDPALGSVGTFGFIAALLILLISGVAGGGASARRGRMAIAGLVALVCFLVGTIGGVSALIALELTPQIRNWNRLSLFIAFASLLVVALLLGALRDRLRSRGQRAAFAAGLVGLAVLGVLDQTSVLDRPPYAQAAASWRIEGDFVRDLDRRLPPGTAVVQLPYVPYPESGSPIEYEHFKGYLHSRDLRWSYGATKGRPADWQDNAAGLAADGLAVAAMAAGFRAVYVDAAGYPDGAAAARAALAVFVTPAQTGTSADGRRLWFDLRGAAARLAARTSPAERRELGDALVHPSELAYGRGFHYQEEAAGVPFRAAGTDAVLALVNPLEVPRRARLGATLAGGTAAESTITVTLPDGRRETVVATDKGVPVAYDLVIPPGGGSIRIQTNGAPTPITDADDRDRRVRVIGATLVPAALETARLARYVELAGR